MRTVAVIKRIFQEMFRDKRTLALLFVAPLLILSLMYLLFNSDTALPRLGVVDIEQSLIEKLETADILVQSYESATPDTVLDEGLDGLLLAGDGRYELILHNNEPTTAKPLQAKVTQIIATQTLVTTISQFTGTNAPNIDIEKVDMGIDTTFIYGSSETVFFDVLMPILVGYFVFFFVFLISGVGLLKERTTGTLERLMATPIRRWEIVTAYLVGFGIFAIIQTIIVVFYSVSVLDIVLEGSIWHVIFINLLLALVALSLGILLSTFAASEFQMVQFIPIVIIPQIFFTGILPLDSMADWLQAIGKVMPMYYAAHALKSIMYKGTGLGEVSGDIVVLLIFATLFIVLNIVALKKYRKL